jgi:hypothetical protein
MADRTFIAAEIPNDLTNVAAPGTPGAGKTTLWTDSTDKSLKAKDDAGVITETVPVPLPITKGGTGQTTKAPAFDALAPTATRGDLIVRGASANGALAIGTSNQVLSTDGTDPIWRNRSFPFGDGSDGDVTIAAPTTLTRDMMYNNLTVNAGQTLKTAGFVVYVNGTLTVAATGVIDGSGGAGGNGVNGAPFTGGAAGAPPYLIAINSMVPMAGGAGGNSVAAGTTLKAGGAASPPLNYNIYFPYKRLHSAGGGGGGAHGSAAATAGVGTPAPYETLVTGTRGGVGGAAGAGTGSAALSGGGGGSGGGWLEIRALTINNAGSIQSLGGHGGEGVTSGSDASGNGGGGVGGVVVVYYRATAGSGVGSLSAAGGAPGTSGNGGTAGAAGYTASYQI